MRKSLILFLLLATGTLQAADPLPYRYWVSHEDGMELASGGSQWFHSLMDLGTMEVGASGEVLFDRYRLKSMVPPAMKELQVSEITRARYAADCDAMTLTLTRIDRFSADPVPLHDLSGRILDGFDHDQTLSYSEDERDPYVPATGTVAYSHLIVACAGTKERVAELLGGEPLSFIPDAESFWRLFGVRQEMIAAYSRDTSTE